MFKVKRPFALVAVLTFLMLGSFLSSGNRDTANAAPFRYEQVVTYYSDPQMTNIVGYYNVLCNGMTTQLQGSSSPYYTVENVNICCGSVPC